MPDPLPYPYQFEIERQMIEVPGLFQDNPHRNVRSKYYFNLLNLRAYLDNWRVLDPQMQRTLTAMLESDLLHNAHRYGMKNKAAFEKHLFLLVGCEIWNIKQYVNTNMVIANLRTNGLYSRHMVKSRIIDPRTCRNAGRKFLTEHDLDRLFRHFDAYIINFESDESYRDVPEVTYEIREKYRAFFAQNVALLKRWGKARLIYSYIYSNEVSCDSILQKQFRPHTHSVVFVPKGRELPDLAGEMPYNDRVLKNLPERHTRLETIRDFISYLHGAYSLAPTYEREYRDENVLQLNINTVHCLRILMELFGTDGLERGYTRSHYSYLPKTGEARFRHPLLNRHRNHNRYRH